MISDIFFIIKLKWIMLGFPNSPQLNNLLIEELVNDF